MKSAGFFLVLLPLISGFKLEKAKDMPPVEEPAKLARWIIHNSCKSKAETIWFLSSFPAHCRTK
jgi:hypothetical protein